ncbi:hypothetical protein HGM15179_001452 [Zosterops borbonicus]|uniref:Uncharacterized protein n=1 Tax=Zosterops borbonicus TaxID=364589 RepID=A0A8K1GUR5_9PASS|nr:hypothetical protein HGM15179_001452 [Zosterops borbonicus]
MTTVSLWMGKGLLHQPYFIVDTAQEVGLNYQTWLAGVMRSRLIFQRPGVCKPGLATFPVSFSSPGESPDHPLEYEEN